MFRYICQPIRLHFILFVNLNAYILFAFVNLYAYIYIDFVNL